MNHVRGYTNLELGSTSYRLKYDINALCCLEKELGNSSLQEIFSESSLNFTWIRAMLWAGMLDANPKITPKQVGRRLDTFFAEGGDIQKVVEVMMSALTEVLPGANTEGGDKGNAKEEEVEEASP